MIAMVHSVVYLLEPVTLAGTVLSTLAGILSFVAYYREQSD